MRQRHREIRIDLERALQVRDGFEPRIDAAFVERQRVGVQRLERRRRGPRQRHVELLSRGERLAQLFPQPRRDAAERCQHLFLPSDFHLLPRHHIAGQRVDGFDGDDVIASQRCDRSGQQRFQLLALRDFAGDRPRDRFVGRPVHQAQGVADAFVREHLQERRLFDGDRQRDLEGAVEHRIAGRVREVCQHDGVLRRQRLIAAPRLEERDGDDDERHDGGNARCQLPPSRGARALLGSWARSRAGGRRQAVGDRLRRFGPGLRIRRERLEYDALELWIHVRQERRRAAPDSPACRIA